MKKLLKVAAVLGVLFVVAAVTAALLAQRLLPPEKVRSLIVTQASQALKREVRLGSVAWSLVHGLSLKDAAVSEIPDFKAGTFAEAKSFNLRVRWLALLRGKVVVDSVSLEDMSLAVAKKPDGSFNFSDLAGSSQTASGQSAGAAAGAAAALPFELAVSRARVSGGRLTYSDPKSGDLLTVSGLDLKVRDFALAGPFAAELSLKASGRSGGKPVEASLAYAGRLDLGGSDPAKVAAEFKKVVVESRGLRLEASGSLKGLAQPAFDLKFEAAAGGKKALAGSATGTVTPPKEGAALAVKADFKAETPGLATDAFKDFGAPAGLKVPAGKAAGRFAYGGDALALEGLRLEAAEGSVTVSGTVKELSGKKPVLDLEVGADLKLPELMADSLPAAGLPKGLVLPPTAVKTKARLKGDDLELASLSLANRFGKAEASGKVSRLSAKQPDLDLSSTFDLDLPAFKDTDLPWAGLPKGLKAPAVKAKGKAKVQGETVTLAGVSVKGSGGGVEVAGTVKKAFSAKPELDGTAVIKVSLPEIKDSDVPFAGLPAGLKLPAASIEGKVSVKGQDAELAGLEVKTAQGWVKATGKVKGALGDSPEPELDLAASLALPAFKSADVPFPQVPPGLEVPAASLDASLWASRDEARIKSVRVKVGKNDIELDGGKVVALRSGKPLFNLLLKCRAFDLAELTSLTPATRDMGLSGTGFFALGVTGRLPKPLLEGKMQFKGLGATVAGLKLADFTGTARFDEKRLDVPNLKGKVGSGELAMDLTVKDYATAPDVDIRAELTEFDLGAFLKAKASLAKPAAEPAGAAPAVKPPPMDFKGSFTVGRLIHPNAEAKDLRVDWQLTGITPDMKSLSGTAKLGSDAGKFNAIGDMAGQSKVVKVLTMPLVVIQKIGRVGGIRLFPDFNNVTYSRLSGAYRFENGQMTLDDSTLVSDAFTVVAVGGINLPAETLDLTVTAQVGNVAPIDVDVKGTFEKPVSKAKIGKFLAAPIKQLFQRAAPK